MKTLLTLGLVCFSMTASMAENLPPYYRSASGTLVTGLLSRNAVKIDFGTLKNCQKKVINGGLLFISYTCDAEGVVAHVTDEKGAVNDYAFTHLFAMVKQLKAGIVQEYHFKGAWEVKGDLPAKSVSELMVYQYEGSTEMKGALNLTDLGVSNAIQATPVASLR